MFLLIPLLAVGLVAFAAGRSSGYAKPKAAIAGALPSGPPTPLATLEAFARANQPPPPEVIMCALAEAELAGHLDVVQAIVRTYIEPVVSRADAIDSAQRTRALANFCQDAKAVLDQPAANVLAHAQATGQSPGQVVEQQLDQAMQKAAASAPPPKPDPRAWTNDAAVVQAAIEAMQHPGAGPQIFDPSTLAPPSSGEDVESAPQGPIISGAAAAMTAPTVDHVQRGHAIPSPIVGLPLDRWEAFALQIRREPATFEGPRHIGQYRQRKERLLELGVDPRSLRVQDGRDERAQDEALALDMADAYKHAAQSGMLHEHVGRTITLPGTGGHAPAQITASGILGVIQAAGLEGAADWLDRAEDRARFPYTTVAFVRTNGLF